MASSGAVEFVGCRTLSDESPAVLFQPHRVEPATLRGAQARISWVGGMQVLAGVQ